MSKPEHCPWCGTTCNTYRLEDNQYTACCQSSDCQAMGPTRETPEEAQAAMTEVVRNE